MRGMLIIWALAACSMPAASAAAEECATASGESRLATRKPVADPDAKLLSGFGLRRHPLLGYTRLHTGIDWHAARGSPVIAAAAGRVTFAGFKSQYGKTVIIDHGGGLTTLYAHLQDIGVREGDCVARRVKIGGVGSTGLTEAVALHFEVQRNGTPVDPFAVAILGD
jgi:murein DD-endopeptidase MepM/ murein hydrolase activator NlpD